MTTMNFEKPEQDEGLTLESHAIDRFASPDEEPIPHTEPAHPLRHPSPSSLADDARNDLEYAQEWSSPYD